MTAIEITCRSCGEILLAAEDVVLARHLPAGDGSLTFECGLCSDLVSIPLLFDEVMTAVFAGVRPIDVDYVRSRPANPGA